MPITKSAKKAVRQSEGRRIRNLGQKRKLKNLLKEIKTLIYQKKIEEQRRLLYVGMTRAKSELILTAVKHRGGWEHESSPFLKDLDIKYTSTKKQHQEYTRLLLKIIINI